MVESWSFQKIKIQQFQPLQEESDQISKSSATWESRHASSKVLCNWHQTFHKKEEDLWHHWLENGKKNNSNWWNGYQQHHDSFCKFLFCNVLILYSFEDFNMFSFSTFCLTWNGNDCQLKIFLTKFKGSLELPDACLGFIARVVG